MDMVDYYNRHNMLNHLRIIKSSLKRHPQSPHKETIGLSFKLVINKQEQMTSRNEDDVLMIGDRRGAAISKLRSHR